jgi:hypothetical protein
MWEQYGWGLKGNVGRPAGAASDRINGYYYPQSRILADWLEGTEGRKPQAELVPV